MKIITGYRKGFAITLQSVQGAGYTVKTNNYSSGNSIICTENRCTIQLNDNTTNSAEHNSTWTRVSHTSSRKPNTTRYVIASYGMLVIMCTCTYAPQLNLACAYERIHSTKKTRQTQT